MIFQQISSGGDRNYGYLIACSETRRGALIDPSPDPFPLYQQCQSLELRIEYIINTHSHFDHTGGNDFFLRSVPGVRLVSHPLALKGDIRVKDGDTLTLGALKLVFLHTPGHTPDSLCVLAGNELITGDTLFVGKIGGTACRDEAEAEFLSLKKLAQLPPATRIWPGHNYGRENSSTMERELDSNPFLLRLNNFDDFLYLKANWAAYKKEHNIL